MQILLLGGPLDGKAWEAPEPPPPLYHGGSFSDGANTIYELRRFPANGGIALAYVATTLSVDEAEERFAAYTRRAP